MFTTAPGCSNTMAVVSRAIGAGMEPPRTEVGTWCFKDLHPLRIDPGVVMVSHRFPPVPEVLGVNVPVRISGVVFKQQHIVSPEQTNK